MSVITAFYNRGSSVPASIGSLVDQSYDNLEIIVVDDGSTDDTLLQLQRIHDPRLRVISRENQGFVHSMNEAIAASSGEYIAVHGSGDLSLPNRVARQAEYLTMNSHTGVVGCWVKTDTTGGSGSWIYKAPNNLPFHETLLKRNLFTHGEVMFRKVLFDKVGGYRDFFKFAQDRDLWLRMSRYCDYSIIPEILYRRYKPEGGVSDNPEKLILQSYLADIAVQCAKTVDSGGKDPIERYGYHAPFFRTPSKLLAKKLAWQGARMMVQGNISAGWEIVQRAKGEGHDWQLKAITKLAGLHRYPILWQNVGKPVLERRIKQFQT